MPRLQPHLPDSAASQPVEGELLFDDAEVRGGGVHGGDAHADRRMWLKLLSAWTDNVFEIPGTGWRFGLDPIIGLVPVAGDLASAVLSFYILSVAAQMRVPRSTLVRMGLNVGIDYVLGSIPVLGNVFDFVWKANQRNMQLLERHMALPPSERRRQGIWDWVLVGAIGVVLVAAFIGSLAAAMLIAAWIARLLGLAP